MRLNMIKFNLMWPNVTSTSHKLRHVRCPTWTCPTSPSHIPSQKLPPNKNLTVEKVTEKFSTSNFLPALSSFLRHIFPGSTIMPSHRDRFDAYKQIVISFPRSDYLGEGSWIMDRVRTSTFVNASSWSLAKPSHFDTAFVVEDLALHKHEGGLSGMFFQVGLYYNINFFFFFTMCRASCRPSSTSFQCAPPNLALFHILSHI